MVNFRDPIVAGRDYLILKSFSHVLNGIYVWEFFMTLGYEFDIIRGRRPYRSTIWIYSLTRVAALLSVILVLLVLNTTTPINCQVWITFEVTFGYIALSAASLLIVIRITAIWDRNKVVMAIATSLWAINVAVLIQGVVRVRSDWADFLPGCIVFNSHSAKLNIIVSLITDILLLLIVLVGLLRLHSDGLGTYGIGRLLWKQGVMWILLATIAEVPPAVLVTMDLNDPLNLMFMLPSLFIMSIAATRMHRSLTEFGSGGADIAPDLLQNGSAKVSRLKWNQAPRSQLEVMVDTAYERSRMSRASHHDPPISTEGQLCEKSHGLDLERDPEKSTENRVPV